MGSAARCIYPRIRLQRGLTFLCTGWRRLIGSPKLQIIFHKRATKYRSLLRKMTYKDKGSYDSSPPCIDICMYQKQNIQAGSVSSRTDQFVYTCRHTVSLILCIDICMYLKKNKQASRFINSNMYIHWYMYVLSTNRRVGVQCHTSCSSTNSSARRTIHSTATHCNALQQ